MINPSLRGSSGFNQKVFLPVIYASPFISGIIASYFPYFSSLSTLTEKVDPIMLSIVIVSHKSISLRL